MQASGHLPLFAMAPGHQLLPTPPLPCDFSLAAAHCRWRYLFPAAVVIQTPLKPPLFLAVIRSAGRIQIQQPPAPAVLPPCRARCWFSLLAVEPHRRSSSSDFPSQPKFLHLLESLCPSPRPTARLPDAHSSSLPQSTLCSSMAACSTAQPLSSSCSPRQPSLPPSSWTPNVDLIPTCSLVESSSSLVVDLPQQLGSNSADASSPWLRTSYGAGLVHVAEVHLCVRTPLAPLGSRPATAPLGAPLLAMAGARPRSSVPSLLGSSSPLPQLGLRRSALVKEDPSAQLGSSASSL
jgi:hypothetical protein